MVIYSSSYIYFLDEKTELFSVVDYHSKTKTLKFTEDTVITVENWKDYNKPYEGKHSGYCKIF